MLIVTSTRQRTSAHAHSERQQASEGRRERARSGEGETRSEGSTSTRSLLPASCVGRTGDGWQSDSLLLAVTRHRITSQTEKSRAQAGVERRQATAWIVADWASREAEAASSSFLRSQVSRQSETSEAEARKGNDRTRIQHAGNILDIILLLLVGKRATKNNWCNRTKIKTCDPVPNAQITNCKKFPCWASSTNDHKSIQTTYICCPEGLVQGTFNEFDPLFFLIEQKGREKLAASPTGRCLCLFFSSLSACCLLVSSPFPRLPSTLPSSLVVCVVLGACGFAVARFGGDTQDDATKAGEELLLSSLLLSFCPPFSPLASFPLLPPPQPPTPPRHNMHTGKQSGHGLHDGVLEVG